MEAGRSLGVLGQPELHRETLSQNKRWEKGVFHPITNMDLLFDYPKWRTIPTSYPFAFKSHGDHNLPSLISFPYNVSLITDHDHISTTEKLWACFLHSSGIFHLQLKSRRAPVFAKPLSIFSLLSELTQPALTRAMLEGQALTISLPVLTILNSYDAKTTCLSLLHSLLGQWLPS